MRFGVLRVVSLDIQVLWDGTLSYWAKNFLHFEQM